MTQSSSRRVSGEGELLEPPPLAWFAAASDESQIIGRELARTDENALAAGERGALPADFHPLPPDSAFYRQHPEFTQNHVPSEPLTNAGLGEATPVINVGAPLPSPSWHEISRQVIPSAASELLTNCLRRVIHTARYSYARYGLGWSRQFSDLGHRATGYDQATTNIGAFMEEITNGDAQLPPFSCLPWVERQMVHEWRTYMPEEWNPAKSHGPDCEINMEDGDEEFAHARTVVPAPQKPPVWCKADTCAACVRVFGPSLLRHHCRLCGQSFCHAHSTRSRPLPHLGYDPNVPERVCDRCHGRLVIQELTERVAWRLARCRDYFGCDAISTLLGEEFGEQNNGVPGKDLPPVGSRLIPYFEVGVDTLEEKLLRVSRAAIQLAKSIPLGAQASVAVETLDVLRKYGLNGIYTVLLRQEFLAAADLLRRVLGINQTAWPLSVHELSAAIFYR
jgi:FYVE zinc finger